MESRDSFKDLQFDGKPSGYRDFRRKTILAVAGLENRHAHLAGPRLLQRLQGEAWRATEHLKIADLRKENGWLEVIHALDLHYRFLPETELHEAVEEFLFSMKRRPGEGATSFSSRFRTQLDRVQTLIAQEREMHRTRKKPRRGRKKRDAPDAEVPETPSSSLEESDKSEDPKGPKIPEQAEPATEEESALLAPQHRLLQLVMSPMKQSIALKLDVQSLLPLPVPSVRELHMPRRVRELPKSLVELTKLTQSVTIVA